MNRIRAKKRRKRNIIIISSIALILILGASFAFFTYRRSIQAFSLTSNQIKAEFTSGTNQINFTNAYPISDEFALANLDKLDYIDFTVSSLSTSRTEGIQYEIYLKENQTNTLDPRYIKVYLTDDEGNKIIKPTLYSNLEYTTYEEDINTGKIVYKEFNLGEISKNFRLYIWLDKEYSQNEVSETFGFKVNLYAYNSKQKTFIEQLKDTPKEDTGIKFYKISSSTNGEGLYMLPSTANDEHPIYYYRGNVNNNNIYFAESCWKIVRTTSTGGLKLIYNGEATVVDGKKQCLQTTGEGTQLPTKTAFNSGYKSPAYVGYNLPASSSIYTWSYNTLSSGVYYGSSIDQTTYELVDPQTTLDNNHHYSYNSTNIHATGIEGETGNVRYYYYQGSSSTNAYFIKFAKTKNIQTVLNEMLSEPVSKENPSTIQSYINTWWSNYDATYGEFLEDTEWCNDRSIGDLGGWNPNGGDLTKILYFTSQVRYSASSFESNPNNIKNTNQPILTCSNVNDKLTVSNGSLTYKIGLLTYDEVTMAGATNTDSNRNYYLYTDSDYWLLSPTAFFNDFANGGSMYSDGGLGYRNIHWLYGARPALSLKLGTTIKSGDGTKENPYIVTTD